jgi:hypothetical protein
MHGLRWDYSYSPVTTRGIFKHYKYKYTRAVCKVRGLAAVRRCYAEGGGVCYAKS